MIDAKERAGKEVQKDAHGEAHERSAPSRFSRFKTMIATIAVLGTIATGYAGCGSNDTQDSAPGIPDAGCDSEAGCVENDAGTGGDGGAPADGGMDGGVTDGGVTDGGAGGKDGGVTDGGDGGAPVDGGVSDGGSEAGSPCPGVSNATRTGTWPLGTDEPVGGYNVRYVGPVGFDPVFDIRCQANGNPVRLGEHAIIFSTATVNVPEDSKKVQISLTSANMANASGTVTIANYP
ncbi:MAG: hypothetical protein U0R44_05790 [Candidatus Micrarchaeia archaeon]